MTNGDCCASNNVGELFRFAISQFRLVVIEALTAKGGLPNPSDEMLERAMAYCLVGPAGRQNIYFSLLGRWEEFTLAEARRYQA
jgi:hypothetical protein